MKIVVVGGTGLIGRQLVAQLRALAHDVVVASPSQGVDTVTGEGLDEAFARADVVVDVSNAPSFDDAAVLRFFQASGRNMAAAEKRAGVSHHVALSVVGTDRLQDSGYFRAKLVQEELIKAAGIPYTIVRATQFYEFLAAIALSGATGGGASLWLPNARFQPIASSDVATAMLGAALGAPRNGIVEIAGPERQPLAHMVERYVRATGDVRPVAGDPDAPYFGVRIDDRSLTPDDGAWLGPVRLDDWLSGMKPA